MKSDIAFANLENPHCFSLTIQNTEFRTQTDKTQ